MKILIGIITAFFTIYSSAFGQGTSGTNAKFEYRNLVDMPTAGILEKGFVGVTLDALPYGVVVGKIEVGVFDNFSFGISYGASNLIGTGSPQWYELPGINLRIRAVNETEATPAITFGFDSQGKGGYYEGIDRYQIKSPGFFAAFSKNFRLLGYLSLHGVINYSLERDDNDKDVNIQIGIEKTIGGRISIVGEWDFAINDNDQNALGDGNGYLNFAAKWSVGEGFTIGFALRDILSNKKLNTYRADRAIFVEYVKAIF